MLKRKVKDTFCKVELAADVGVRQVSFAPSIDINVIIAASPSENIM